MKNTRFYGVVALALCCLLLTGCSGSKEGEQTKAGDTTATQQAAEAMKDYAKKPMDRARAAQQLGEARVKAVDEAAKQQ